MAFPLPLNMTGNVTSLAVYANTATGNMFWNIMFLALLVSFLGILLNRGTPKEESFALVSFLGLIIGGMLASLQLISTIWLFLFAMLLSLSAALLWKRGSISY